MPHPSSEGQLALDLHPLPPATALRPREDWLGHLRPWIRLCEQGIEPFAAWSLLTRRRRG